MEGNDPERTWIMPKRTTAVISAAAVILLTLTGCAGAPDETPSEPETVATVTAEETPEGSPEPALTAAPEPTGPDATYLHEVRKRTDVATVAQATDEQLLAAGHAACDALAANPDVYALRLIEGEEPGVNGVYVDSAVIGNHAATHLCPTG